MTNLSNQFFFIENYIFNSLKNLRMLLFLIMVACFNLMIKTIIT